MPTRILNAVLQSWDAIATYALSILAAIGSVAMTDSPVTILGFPVLQAIGLLGGSIAEWGVRGAAYAELPPERRRPLGEELRLRAFWASVALIFGALWAHYAVDFINTNWPGHAASAGLVSFVCVFMSMAAIDILRALRRIFARQSTERALEGLVIGFIRKKAGLPPEPPAGEG